MTLFNVTKINAAGCQLDTAIELFFREIDDISVCVLIHSSWSIIKDICKLKKIETTRDWAIQAFPDEEPIAIWKELDSYWNFFKHAKDDSKKSLNFDSSYLDEAIFLVIHDFSQLSIQSKTIDIFQLWYVAKSENFKTEKHKELYIEALKIFPNVEKYKQSEQRKAGLVELNKTLNSEF